MRTNAHEVVIAGGGPTGLMLAGELALAGVDVAIVERRVDQAVIGSRAGGLHARTIEMLEQRGIADRFLAEGTTAQVAGFGLIPLDISDFPTRHPYGLGLWQKHIERLLAEWVGELAITMYRGSQVTGFRQDGSGVDVALSAESTLRAQYLVGCDGGRSLVRKTAGIDFAGWDPSMSALVAEVQMTEEPAWGMRRDNTGVHGISRLDEGVIRILVSERDVAATTEPTVDDLKREVAAVYGTDFGIHSPASISRFTDMTRQASAYRKNRVLLAGDAAHIHSPTGGQGLNTGVQDAMNLGWKLAQVVTGSSPEALLDSYQAERYPVAERVLRDTMAQTALIRFDDRNEALRESVAELLAMDEPRKRFAGVMSGLDIRYDLGQEHPLLGRRMPDLDLATGEGTIRLFSLLHRARPWLINFGEPGRFELPGWRDRVGVLDAESAGEWELPVVGRIPACPAVLVRPDGYVAWVDDCGLALEDALTTWCGQSAPA